MDRLTAMQTFVDIVDAGSLTAAATRRGRSLPAVVRTLALLEERLDTRLLRRTTRRMSLTEEGRGYLARCRRILADVEEAELAVQSTEAEPAGEVRLTAPVLFGQLHVEPALTTFLHQYPRVKARLLLLDRVVDLVEEGLDLALRIGPLADSAMVAIPVGTMRRVVCVSPQALTRLGVPEAPDALRDLPCLVHGQTAASAQWRFSGGRGIAVQGPLRCNQARAVAQAAVAGLGFAQLLHYQVADLVACGDLRIVLETFEVEPLPVSLVYPEARRVTPRVRALARHLQWTLEKRLAPPAP